MYTENCKLGNGVRIKEKGVNIYADNSKLIIDNINLSIQLPVHIHTTVRDSIYNNTRGYNI